MLVITCKPGELIKIGDDTEVKLLSIKSNHVRIGVRAPDDVDILREEDNVKTQDEQEI
jgi:carbon storage regulator